MRHQLSVRRLSIAFVLVATGLLVGGPAAAQDKESAKTRILFIGKSPDHPHGTHMYMHTSRMLAKCVEKNGNIETVVSNGWPKDEKQLANVKTIVLYATPGAEFLIDGKGVKQFRSMMKNGVGLVTIHWASSVFEKNLARLGKEWASYLGGYWVSNYGLSTDKSLLKQLQPQHPICRGWKEYQLRDEFYLKPVMKKATPLLQVTTKGEDVIVGWAYDRPDGGRGYGTTLGHFYGNFQIDSFRRTVVNAILWTAKVEIPKDGAIVEINDKLLALPPLPKKSKNKKSEK